LRIAECCRSQHGSNSQDHFQVRVFRGVIALWCVVSDSGSNHRENHFEPLQRLEGVGLTGGHENHLAALQTVRLASDADFRLAFEQLHERIERTCVLTQALSFIEREDGPYQLAS
jgi:hypothetical protein